MSEHTPGPWTVAGDSIVVGPSGNVIAECCGYSVRATDPAQRAQGGREANARLIAAAPEMLSLLTEFLCDQETLCEPYSNKSLCEKAVELLARIEGREAEK